MVLIFFINNILMPSTPCATHRARRHLSRGGFEHVLRQAMDFGGFRCRGGALSAHTYHRLRGHPPQPSGSYLHRLTRKLHLPKLLPVLPVHLLFHQPSSPTPPFPHPPFSRSTGPISSATFRAPRTDPFSA